MSDLSEILKQLNQHNSNISDILVQIAKEIPLTPTVTIQSSQTSLQQISDLLKEMTALINASDQLAKDS